jgi:hypothetical protein
MKTGNGSALNAVRWDGMVGSAIFATLDLYASIRWAGACRQSVTLVVRKTDGGSKTVVK